MIYTRLWQRLSAVYSDDYAKSLARYVLSARFGMSFTEMVTADAALPPDASQPCHRAVNRKSKQLTSDDHAALEEIIARLLRSEPVQYVLGWAMFSGRRYTVTPAVLIPRPETEELCRMVCDDASSLCGAGGLSADMCIYILDIGTGSGCIAVTTALALPWARVTAWDISAEVLAVAERNASALGASVTFCRQDALHAPSDVYLWDVIVSNPPYVCEKEKATMDRDVLDYEPASALFVPDSDPLLFYRAVALYGSTALKAGGRLYFELNPLYASSVGRMLEEMGYVKVTIRTDTYGKRRFARAVKHF